jgi:hypothetical protein
MTDHPHKLDRLAMHQEWYDKNRTLLFIEASVVMQELLAMCRQYKAEHDALRAERDEVRQSYCSLMEAYRGGDGRVTANKLGWGYLFEEDKPCQ